MHHAAAGGAGDLGRFEPGLHLLHLRLHLLRLLHHVAEILHPSVSPSRGGVVRAAAPRLRTVSIIGAGEGFSTACTSGWARSPRARSASPVACCSRQRRLAGLGRDGDDPAPAGPFAEQCAETVGEIGAAPAARAGSRAGRARSAPRCTLLMELGVQDRLAPFLRTARRPRRSSWDQAQVPLSRARRRRHRAPPSSPRRPGPWRADDRRRRRATRPGPAAILPATSASTALNCRRCVPPAPVRGAVAAAFLELADQIGRRRQARRHGRGGSAPSRPPAAPGRRLHLAQALQQHLPGAGQHGRSTASPPSPCRGRARPRARPAPRRPWAPASPASANA